VNNSHIPLTSQSIELKKFDLHHQPYIIRYPSIIQSSFRNTEPAAFAEELISSIRQYGLLYPIIVQKGKGEELFIVHGARRFSASQCIGWDAIPCQVIPQTVDLQEVYQFSLSVFLSHQKPNIIEQARIMQKLRAFVSEDVVIGEFLPRLGLPPQRKVFSRISQLAELEDEIAHDLAVGEADPQLGWRMLKLPPAARLPMYRFLRQLPFTVSQQFEILEYIQEVSHRDQSSLEELLAHPAVQDILASDPDLRRKANSIRLFWRARRYPRLTGLEEEFAERRKMLHLPEHLELYPPRNFEHGNYKFELRFSDCAELQQKLDFLNRLINTKTLKSIIEQ